MWKIVGLFALLIVAQATDMQDFYGDWIQVAFYPVVTHIPLCIRFSFAKSTDNMQCTYDDGRNASLFQATILTDMGDLMNTNPMPMRVVDTPEEVMPALNISLKCGDKVVRVTERAVLRLVNKDYFILYSHITASMEHTRSAVEQNSAKLFGRNVVSSEELYNVMMSIEDLKNRQGAQMCNTENYRGFKNPEIKFTF